MRQASCSKVALFVSQLLNLLNKAKLEASWSLKSSLSGEDIALSGLMTFSYWFYFISFVSCMLTH